MPVVPRTGRNVENKDCSKALSSKDTAKPKESSSKLTDDYYKKMCENKQELSDHKKFKYSFPVLRGLVAERKRNSGNIRKKKTSKNGKRKTSEGQVGDDCAIFSGRDIDISERFECKTFIGYNTKSCIGCFDWNGTFICVGLRSDALPVNVFEQKGGPSRIAIFDTDLRLVRTLSESLGSTLQVKMHDNALYALFSSGLLVKYSDMSSEYEILEKGRKIVAFDVNSEILAYTDGLNLTVNKQTRKYDGVIIKVLVYSRYVIILDVNGRVYVTTAKMEDSREIIAKYTITNIEMIESSLFIFEDSQYSIVFPFSNEKCADELNRKFMSFFVGTPTGKIVNNKRYKLRRKSKEVFQVSKRDGIVHFRTNQWEFDEDKRERIVNVVSDSSSFIFCTEDGLILKVYYF